MLFTRICALEGCGVKFQTDNARKKFCSPVHKNRGLVRAWKRRKRNKKGGGDDGGGGGVPVLIESIQTVDPRATYSIESDKSTPNRYSVKRKKPAGSVNGYPQKKAFKAAA